MNQQDGDEKMLIPTPAVVAAYLATIPKGEPRTMPPMSEDWGALTAGIVLRIAAMRAWQQCQSEEHD